MDSINDLPKVSAVIIRWDGAAPWFDGQIGGRYDAEILEKRWFGGSTCTVDFNRIQLFSPLPPAECVSRLVAVMDTEQSAIFSLAGLFGSKPVIGRVTETSLQLRKRIGYRNSFQSFLAATLRPEAGGTVISGEVAMHAFVKVFMFIWFGGVILIGGTAFVVTAGTIFFGSSSQHQNAWMGAVIPTVMLLFGFGLVRFGRFLARDEARFLTDFLMQTLNAHAQDRAA